MKEIDWNQVRQLCLESGADDVGWVSVDHPLIQDQRDDVERAMPGTRTLISLVARMNRESIRSPQRSVSNLEFHLSGGG